MNDDNSGIHSIVILILISLIIILVGRVGRVHAFGTGIQTGTKYETELRGWIDLLVSEESGGREDIQIIDSNGKHSRGCGMFQDSTWDAYTEKYNVTHYDRFNCEEVKELIYKMIYDHYNNWGHWRCSVVDTKDSELCTSAFNKLGWKPKKGIGKPPLRELRKEYAERARS